MNEDQALRLEESLINLSLPVRGINAILAALAKQPYESVVDLINEVRSQGLPQFAEYEKQILAETE